MKLACSSTSLAAAYSVHSYFAFVCLPADSGKNDLGSCKVPVVRPVPSIRISRWF